MWPVTIPQRVRLYLLFWTVLLLLCALPAPLQAQGIIVEPPPLPRPQPPLSPSLVLLEHHVDAVIDGPVATVHVTQRFRNPTGQTLEGVYLFPLPPDAAVGSFQMKVDGSVLEGRLLSADEARRIYTEIVRQQRDPALLEYTGRGLFQTSVFPIPPGAEREVELTYHDVLVQEGGLYRFLYPLRTAAFSSAPVDRLSIDISLRGLPGLRTIYSASHPIAIERKGTDAAEVRVEASSVQPEGDFTLFFGAADEAVAAHLLSYAPAGEDGFLLAVLAPEVKPAAQGPIARDLLLVLDVSGSMEGEKMEQARTAAHYLVDHLNPNDRFNLITFSTGVSLWQNRPQPVDTASLEDAHAWLDRVAADGSTDINRALLEAMAGLAPDESRPAIVLFLTDGLPTQGVVEPQQIIHNVLNNRPAGRSVRLFTFGVGYDVNTDLLDTLAGELGGLSSYVRPEEAIDEVVSSFFSGISLPVLTDVRLDFGPDVVVSELYPYPLPDLFAGQQLVVAGRYRLPVGSSGGVPLTLLGRVNGADVSYTYDSLPLATAGGEPFVPRLWATRKIGALLDQIRRSGGQKELVDAVVSLSLQYGIVTPYTSFLVEEPAAVAASEQPLSDFSFRSRLLRGSARMAEEAQDLAAAAPSGAEAVAFSADRQALKAAEGAPAAHEDVRYVEGKTFTSQTVLGEPDEAPVTLWVDSAYGQEMPLETVLFGSDRYFALAADPRLAAWLSVSTELLLALDDGTALRVTADEAAAPSAPASPLAAPDASHEPGGGLLDWLWKLLGE